MILSDFEKSETLQEHEPWTSKNMVLKTWKMASKFCRL